VKLVRVNVFLAFTLSIFFASHSNAICFEEIYRESLRQELGLSGSLADRVKMALRKIREMKLADRDIKPQVLADKWRDYVIILEETPYFKSGEIENGEDIVFTGNFQDQYYFIAITTGVPTGLYYGVRSTPVDSKTVWREDNTRFETW
jgi:hypothetical protein